MNDNTPGTGKSVWIGFSAVLFVMLLALSHVPVLTAQGGQNSPDQAIALFEQVYRFIQRNYVEEVDPEVLLQGALQGMFDSLDDPYSAYLKPDQMRGLTDTTSGQFGGVGMYINKPAPREGRPQYIEVVSPIEDTPAFRAGLMAGDRIRAVEGESTAELSTDEVVERLRGRPGTPVTITILRGADIEFPVTLERAIIQIPTARWAMIDEHTAFLRIIQFTPHTAERVAEALQEFRSDGFRSLIIDLRSNPGGLLTGVVDVADLFFDGGTVVETRGRVASENQTFTARSGSLISDDIEIVVLIDGGSASAAEILAAALKDRDRATLIGTTTFGKGSVQQVRRIGDSGFRLTMSRYYSPIGTSIDKAGVAPTIEVEEEELTEEQQQAYATIRREDRVRTFLEATPDPSGAQIDRFVQGLQDDGLDPGDRLLRRFIRMEINRINNREQVFDLEYDRVLQRAVEYLRR